MRKIASRRFHEARRMREASIHEYRFLISDGNGAASRGGEPDTYFERKVRAANLKNAVIKIFPDLNYGGDSFKDYLDDYYGDDPDRPEFETGEDIMDWLEENTDITGGDPWIEGYAVDGKIINPPSYLNEILEESSREEAEDYLDGVDLDFWGFEFYDDDEEDDDDYEESDYNWRDWGYLPTYEEMTRKFPTFGTTAIVATTNYLASELAKASQEKEPSFFTNKDAFESCTDERMISLLREVKDSLKGKKIYTDYEGRDREKKIEAVDAAIEYLQSSKNEDLEEAKRILSRGNKRFTESSESEGGFISVKRALNLAKKLSDAHILAEGSLYAPESTGCALPDREGFIVVFATSTDYIKFFEKVTQQKMDGFSRLAAQMAYGLDRAMMVAYAENTFIQGFVDMSERLPDVDIGNVTFVDVDENGESASVNKTHLGTEVFDNWAHNKECPTWHSAAMALVKILN